MAFIHTKEVDSILEKKQAPRLQYSIIISKLGNDWYGNVIDDLGIYFTTRRQRSRKQVVNDMLIFIKLFIDFTMSEKKCKQIKNLKNHKVGKFYVH